MLVRRQGRLLGKLGEFLLIYIAASGCQSTRSDGDLQSHQPGSGTSPDQARASVNPNLIQPSSIVHWSIEDEEEMKGEVIAVQYQPAQSVIKAGPQSTSKVEPEPTSVWRSHPRGGEITGGTAKTSQWRPLKPSNEPDIPIDLSPPPLPNDEVKPDHGNRSPPPPPPLPESVAKAGLGPPEPSKDVPLPPPRLVPQPAPEPPKTGNGSQGQETAAPREPGFTPIPREGAKISLPAYVIEPPDILLIESTQGLKDQPIRGQHLVRPDGTVNMGIYGSVFVGGMTLEQAKEAIARLLALRIQKPDLLSLNVDVLAYNSKFYYIITDGGGYGEQVIRLPITGSETVLDGISQIYGLPAVASKKHIWVARRSSENSPEQVLPVDWIGLSQRGSSATNYQILPGDRIYVNSDRWIRFDSGLAKRLSPFERILGITLLGSETVNSIRGRGVFGGR